MFGLTIDNPQKGLRMDTILLKLHDWLDGKDIFQSEFKIWLQENKENL